MSGGEYLLGVAELAVVGGSLAYASWRLRARLIPAWGGAPARLVEVVVWVGILTCLLELLGLFGLMREIPLLLASAGIGAAAWRFAAPAAEEGGAELAPAAPEFPPVPAFGLLVTVGVVGLLVAHWGFETKQALDAGMANFDSLWYHMPLAADMAQSGSTTGLHYTDTVFLNWLYPQNSEILHSAGIVLTERDTLSLFLNFLWLGVALLAAWCIGRPYGRGHLTVAAAAIILEAHTLVVREPGAAKNDVAAAALLLAAIAIFITARSAWRAQNRSAPESAEGGVIGWPMAVAGLAAGLAAGTKVTVLAGVAALTVAAIALAPAGRRRAASAWWFVPLLAGGAFWYVKNLVVSANPIPQVRSLGPIGLPGPDRLQSGRPDFTVLHYATDTGVWRDYFEPGLNEAFGGLWPIVLGAAIAGALIAVFLGRDRVVRWSGVVALVALLAYPATPLSAAGADGVPDAFGINIRFVVPAVLAGLVLLPLARVFDAPRRQWALLASLLVVMVLTNRSDAVVRVAEAEFGIALAVLAVGIPAALLFARSRGAPRAALLAGAGALAAAVVAIGYPVQDDYLEDRFGPAYDFAGDLDPAYRWANDLSDERIGLAGTTAGFLEYGFYGRTLSNRVRYLGREAPKGGYDAIPTCSEFRTAVNDADLDYLVTASFLNFLGEATISSPEAGWLRGEAAVEPILRRGDVTIWQVRGTLDPGGCGPRNAPLRQVPDQPGA